MRALTIIPLALLAAGCWTPGPSQVDPSLYPLDPINRKGAEKSSQAIFCVVAVQPVSGVIVRGNAAAPSGCGSGFAGKMMSELFRLHTRALFGKYGALLLPHDGILVSRSNWAVMSPEERRLFIWHSAIWEAAGAGRPITVEVHIRDTQGIVFVRQRVSTGYGCRPANQYPDRIWYRC